MEGSTTEEQPVPHLRNASTHTSLPSLLFVPTINLDSVALGAQGIFSPCEDHRESETFGVTGSRTIARCLRTGEGG